MELIRTGCPPTHTQSHTVSLRLSAHRGPRDVREGEPHRLWSVNLEENWDCYAGLRRRRGGAVRVEWSPRLRLRQYMYAFYIPILSTMIGIL